MSGKRKESERRKAAARAKDLQEPPRVGVVLEETNAGKALIKASNDEEMRLVQAAAQAHIEANDLAERLDVDARQGARARVKKRSDNPEAWDAVVAAFDKAADADAARDDFRNKSQSSPDAVALDILNRAIAGAHCDPRLADAPRVLDFATCIRNVVMAAQPGMTLSEMLQPFYIKGGGRPQKADTGKIRNTRRWAEEDGHQSPVAETARRHGVSRRTVARHAPKSKKPIK